MKKLLIVFGLSLCAFISKAQTKVIDTLHVNLRLTVPQVETVLNGISELKVKDGITLYLLITNQTQVQIQDANAANLPKIPKTDSSAAKKEEPTKVKK